LQRYLKEVDEVRIDIDVFVLALEKKYGLFETGDIGANLAPDERDAHRHLALLALRQAYEEAGAEIEDRELTGEA
jgi:glycine/D-amino acid oxidase-like deaminating enzyme